MSGFASFLPVALLAFVFVLGIVVVVHELGHYWAGRIFDTEIDDDYSIGYYVHAGAWWMFHQSLGVGLDARYADGSDYRLVGESVDSASTQLLLGLRWAF